MYQKEKVSKLFSVELIPLLGFSSGARLQEKWKWRSFLIYGFSPAEFCILSEKVLAMLITFWWLNFSPFTFSNPYLLATYQFSGGCWPAKSLGFCTNLLLLLLSLNTRQKVKKTMKTREMHSIWRYWIQTII